MQPRTEAGGRPGCPHAFSFSTAPGRSSTSISKTSSSTAALTAAGSSQGTAGRALIRPMRRRIRLHQGKWGGDQHPVWCRVRRMSGSVLQNSRADDTGSTRWWARRGKDGRLMENGARECESLLRGSGERAGETRLQGGSSPPCVWPRRCGPAIGRADQTVHAAEEARFSATVRSR